MRHLLWLWWTQGPAQANDRAVIPPKVDLVIFSNAPKIGWGAHLLEFSNRRSLEKARSPRPYKLLGAGGSISASQSFCHLIKGNHVQFGLDNRTAVAYINRLGGTRSHHLKALTLHMWCYTLGRNMAISAIHFPGKWNFIADGKSRIFHDSIEWMQDRNLFKQITKHLGLPVVPGDPKKVLLFDET